MDTVLTLLALAGVAAVAWHIVRAALRFLRHGAAGFRTEEMARNYARRGDVTALEEARAERARAERSRSRSGWIALGWLVLLVAPSFTSWARPIYAAYSLLLLEPIARRVREGGR